ncbi:MAG TPA: pitrilysin family protein [Gemmatimonadaceae bacterium]|nr:pitrilysin family protein [Gemmatimonadaceae bacterium]
MHCGIVALFALLTAPGLLAQTPRATTTAQDIPDIKYEKFVLPNGLTVLVHEDHKAPIVAVNVWYHVGSKNEKIGRTGFAHLFEHLMFNGSENFNDDYFKPLEKVGATDLNGTTNFDRTNYFQNVPTSALDLVLFMESDRMGHLLGAVDQARLDEQRGVVQNEKRQGENQPYGKAFSNIVENTYPRGHPYSWSVIGSMEDLSAAALADVQDWFKTYYGPNNAVIVIAGDIDVATARQKVEKYFGAIPPSPPIAKQDKWVAKMTGTHRGMMQDRVPQARIYKIWNVPEWGTPEADYLSLVANVLADGKTSRLYKRLVYDERIATDVQAFVFQKEIGSQFFIQARPQPGGDLAAVERAIDEELARFLQQGPTPAELQRVKTQFRSNFIRGAERIGGFGGKSDVLATNMVYAGNPDHYRVTLGRVANATAAQLRTAARDWLSDGVYILEVHPFPQLQAASRPVDRSKLPDVAPPPAPKFPDIATATLSNGLKVYLAERNDVPLVNFNLMVDAGYAADQGRVLGTASLAMNMLDEGTRTRSALQISDALQRLGAQLGTGSDVDVSTVSLSTLKANMDSSLQIFADVILNPSFPQSDFERLRKLQLAQIQREKVTPVQMALRVFPVLLYGSGHAYGIPLTGSGTEESVTRLTTADLTQFHRTWFKPNNASLIVVGATTLAEITPKLERLFGSWQRGEVPRKNIADVAHQPRSAVYLIDRPGSEQSIIFAGHVAPPKRNPAEIAIITMNDILGGSFTSRVNMNLREGKHWSYGAFSLLFDARGQRPFIVYAPVQTDKTKESLAEVVSELRGIVRDKPVTPEELAKAQANLTLSLPGQWETIGAVGGSIAEIVRFDLPHDYYNTFSTKVRELQVADLANVARETVQPDKLVWVVVGDRTKIEAGIRELNLGPLQFLDADGKPAQMAEVP